MSEKVTKKIVLSELTKQIEDGMKKVELAAFYGLPVTQMTKVLQQAKLKIRKFHLPAFVLENDLETSGEVANLAPIAPETKVVEEAPVVEEVTEITTEITEEVVAPVIEEAPAAEEVIEVEVNTPKEVGSGWENLKEAPGDTLEGLLPR